MSSLVLCLLLWICGSAVIAASGFAQGAAAAPCSQKEYRQLDFWIGDWDVSDFDDPTVVDAHVRVERILDGCVLHETYQDQVGVKGESFSIYDATTHTWHQSWVTNRGRLLLLNGRLIEESMILTGEDRTTQGQDRIVRGTWKPIKDGVRETAQVSLDHGRTWTPWFDCIFRPHKPR